MKPSPLLAGWQMEVVREEEMVAEAATVEAVWVVEPPLLEHLLDQEILAYCSEAVSFQLPLKSFAQRIETPVTRQRI